MGGQRSSGAARPACVSLASAAIPPPSLPSWPPRTPRPAWNSFPPAPLSTATRVGVLGCSLTVPLSCLETWDDSPWRRLQVKHFRRGRSPGPPVWPQSYFPTPVPAARATRTQPRCVAAFAGSVSLSLEWPPNLASLGLLRRPPGIVAPLCVSSAAFRRVPGWFVDRLPCCGSSPERPVYPCLCAHAGLAVEPAFVELLRQTVIYSHPFPF